MTKPTTYKVYLRWPGQRVSDKTTTESQAVANYAFCDLLHRFVGQDCAATMTMRNGGDHAENLHYFNLVNTVGQSCSRCFYTGAFIDDGETCPNCKLVQ